MRAALLAVVLLSGCASQTPEEIMDELKADYLSQKPRCAYVHSREFREAAYEATVAYYAKEDDAGELARNVKKLYYQGCGK